MGPMARSENSGLSRSLIGVFFGVLVAVAVSYCAFYILLHFGLGPVSAAGDAPIGRSSFSLAALNLYASQHVEIVGRSTEVGMSGVPGTVSSAILIPLSIWAVIPALALILGGYTAAMNMQSRGPAAMTLAAVLSGSFYALVLAVFSGVVYARIESFLMPELAGFEPSPHDAPFKPSAVSSLLYAGLFGLVFSYIGSASAARNMRRKAAPGVIWACSKAVIVGALIVQLVVILLAGAATLLARRGNDSGSAVETRGMSIVELLPTAAGLGYTVVHGATWLASVQTHVPSTGETTRLLHARVGLQTGLERDDLLSKRKRGLPAALRAVAYLLGALGAVLMGRLAVRWGSRDGSLPTALRVAFVHTLYLVLLCRLCDTALRRTEEASVQSLAVGPQLGWWVLASFVAVLVLALVGASGAKRGVPEV